MMGGRHIPQGGTTQAERSTTSTLRQIGPVWEWAVGRAARCGRCTRRPGGRWIAGRGAWSIAPVKRARMRGDDDMHWANRSEHLLSRRLVAPLSRTSIMFSSVKTEGG